MYTREPEEIKFVRPLTTSQFMPIRESRTTIPHSDIILNNTGVRVVYVYVVHVHYDASKWGGDVPVLHYRAVGVVRLLPSWTPGYGGKTIAADSPTHANEFTSSPLDNRFGHRFDLQVGLLC